MDDEDSSAHRLTGVDMQQVPAPMTVLLAVADAGRRRAVRRVVDADPGLTVVGEARHERELMALLARLRPAVLMLELEFGSGLELVEQVMGQRAVPILAVAPVEGADDLAAAALAAGAVDVVGAQPWLPGGPAAAMLAQRLRLVARVRVISHPRSRLRAAVAPAPRTVVPVPAPPAPAVPSAAPVAEWNGTGGRAADQQPVDLVVIGASTGGPPALARVLQALPPQTGTAVLVVQHMAEGFVEDLVDWLDQQLAVPVVLARAGERLRAGRVAVAPGGLNTMVDAGLRVRHEQPPPGQFHTPGVDATMLSLAGWSRLRVLGVLLTGMGRDGAQGMLALRSAGHPTLGQDQASSVVYGMPMAAHQVGGVGAQLPLGWIGPAVASWCRPPTPAVDLVGATAERLDAEPVEATAARLDPGPVGSPVRLLTGLVRRERRDDTA